MQGQQQPPMQAPRELQVAYGGSSGRAREEAAQRTELFAGASTAAGGAGAGGLRPLADYDAMDNRQLADHAVAQHKETTASAKRSLAIVEQTKEIQATTLSALRDQGKQMQGISAGMDKLGSDLSYSERMLKFMRRCCCVGLFCACCFEPEGKNERDRGWRGEEGTTTYKVAPPPPAIVALQQREAKERAEQQRLAKKRGGGAGAAAASSPPQAYRGPSGSGLAAAGMDEHAASVAAETAQQNDYLDQIAAGLEGLKQGAVAMNGELRRQEAHADEMADDARELHARLQGVNRTGFRGI